MNSASASGLGLGLDGPGLGLEGPGLVNIPATMILLLVNTMF